jgi:hypothetical protein
MAAIPQQLSFMELGIDRACRFRGDLLADVRVRVEALALGRADRTASANDIAIALADLERTPADLGNAAGAIFRDGRWYFTGEWIASARDSNHLRPVRVWKLK